ATTQSFKWVVEKTEGPEEWEFQLCDKNQCFAFAVASNIDTTIGLSIPVTLEPNTISIMDLGVKPNGMAGHGIYKVNVSTGDDPGIILASATYDFQINNTTSTTNFNKKPIKIFPNPVTDYFSLTDNEVVQQIQIFNIVGKKMMDMPFRNGDAIDVASFPNGLYLVRMMGENGEVLKTTRMTKR
ncbi:MAG TPA: T9SS type A sorting domain-containing protein, partial [Phaeodactylibacter sp.]|nr:T9SS type A sorting domain-containing protein [Phaeodactylibacter sp.]